MINKQSPKRIYWSYSIYGVDYTKYYEPVLSEIVLAISLNINVIISTTDKFEKAVIFYFRDYLSFLNIRIFSSMKFNKKEKILRYIVLDSIEYDFVFVKDSDSNTSSRELFIMTNWMNLNFKNCLIIRDHELHISPILAGMFGFNKQIGSLIVDNCKLFFNNFDVNDNNIYIYDQIWLARNIYPLIIDKSLVYTRYFLFQGEKYARIPKSEFGNNDFIGAQRFFEKNNSPERNFLKFYKQDLLSIPYVKSLPYFLFNRIYNRVRPSIYLAFLLSKIKSLF